MSVSALNRRSRWWVSAAAAAVCAPLVVTTFSPTAVPSASALSAGPLASAQLCQDAQRRSAGHFDISLDTANGQFRTLLKDDTLAHLPAAQRYQDLDTYILEVSSSALVQVPESFRALAEFTNDRGELFMLPITQDPKLPWPGYNTQEVDYSALNGPVTLEIRSHSIPEGATWGMWTSDSFNNVDILISSAAHNFDITIDHPAHAHASWGFSHPGTYQLEVTYRATDTQGQALRSEPKILTVVVGDEDIAQSRLCASSEVPPAAMPPVAPPQAPTPTTTAPTSTAPSPTQATPTSTAPSTSSSATTSATAPSTSSSTTTRTTAPATSSSTVSSTTNPDTPAPRKSFWSTLLSWLLPVAVIGAISTLIANLLPWLGSLFGR